jgi:phosphoserine phosphatase RsbU/P
MSDILLIVDDETDIRNSLERNLKKWAVRNKISLESVRSGNEALLFLQQNHEQTAVIISDQKMPNKKGSDFLKEVADIYPLIVSIILTGYADTSEIGSYIEAGIFSFLEKPWDRDVLVSEAEKALQVFKLRRIVKNQEKLMRSELKFASEFQNLFLKIEPKASKSLEFDYSHINAQELSFGGDYYDIIRLDNEKYLLLLGDVSGHGLKASFLVAVLKAMISTRFSSLQTESGNTELNNITPEGLLYWLNRQVHTILYRMPDLFLAFSVCIVDGIKKELLFANAGQPPLMVISETGVTELSPPEIVLGVNQDAEYSSTAFSLKSGDIIFLCTDGIYPSGNRFRYIDLTLFHMLLMEQRGKENINESIINSIQKVEKKSFSEDDITILSARVV